MFFFPDGLSPSNAAILGGEFNCLRHSNTFILGSNITTTQTDTTFVNHLNISDVDTGTSNDVLILSSNNIVEKKTIGLRLCTDKKLSELIVFISTF